MSGAGPILMILWKELARFNLFFLGVIETMEQDGAFIMTNCAKPKALPGNMDSEQKQVDVGYV